MRPRRRRPALNERVVPRARPERINEEIRVPRVRLVDENGGQVGIIATREAVEFAEKKGLDLVEVAPGADPPMNTFRPSRYSTNTPTPLLSPLLA